MQTRWPKILLAVLVVVLIAVVAIALFGGGDDEVTLTPGEAQIVSVSQLEDFAENAPHPVYWVGEKDGVEYELSEVDDGRIFIRYLPEGEGAETAEALTVASYPLADASGALEKTANQGQGTELAKSDEGAVVLIDPKSPNNIHMAYPDEDLQIEVFSPVAGEALRLSKDSVQEVP